MPRTQTGPGGRSLRPDPILNAARSLGTATKENTETTETYGVAPYAHLAAADLVAAHDRRDWAECERIATAHDPGTLLTILVQELISAIQFPMTVEEWVKFAKENTRDSMLDDVDLAALRSLGKDFPLGAVFAPAHRRYSEAAEVRALYDANFQARGIIDAARAAGA